MSKLSIWKKLAIFWQVSKSSYLFLIVLAILLFLGFMFFTTNKKNSKKRKYLYAISSAVILILMVAFYHGSLANIFDYMMNNLFIAIYFPNLAIYFAAIIIMNIILWVSLFNFKTTSIIKKINIVIYVIMNYLLALLLSVINTNKLDIFNQASVYGNNNARALIELSSFVFVIWIIFLIVYKIILTYIRKDYRPKVKKVIIKKRVRKLPDNFIPTTTPEYILGNKKNKEAIIFTEPIKSRVIEPIEKDFVIENKDVVIEKPVQQTVIVTPKEETIVIKTDEEPSIIEQMVEEPKKVVEKVVEETKQVVTTVVDEPKIIATSDNLSTNFEQMLTVEDYKLLLRMLQEQKEKERLEKLRKEQLAKEENKFVELQALYRSAR
jgi:hypothetical protein